MYKLDEAKILEAEKKAAALRAAAEKAVDEIYDRGFKNVFFVGIGGTITVAMAIQSFVETNSTLPFYTSNAGELIHCGNKNIGPETVVFVESASGDTPEMVAAVKYCKEKGARVYGIIEKADSPLARDVDVLMGTDNPGYYGSHYFFGCMMKKWGDFDKYDALADAMDKLPEKIVEAEKAMDAKAVEYAEKYADAPINYLIGAGNTWGAAYCLAMCYMEEMQWMVTKSIHAAEFFHGTLEVIEKGVSVLLFKGEDGSRAEVQRAEDFCRRVTNDVTVFDAADYDLCDDESLRGFLSPFLFHSVMHRIFMNLENVNKHPGDIRRYYRRLTY